MTTNTVVPLDDTLALEAVDLVKHWLAESRKYPADAAAQRLAGVLSDPNGLKFTVGFVDGVVRPEDPRVAARTMRELAGIVPAFLPWHLRSAFKLGAALAPAFPGIVVPVARKVLRTMVRHLIVDASDHKLGKAIRDIKGRDTDVRLNINLLGEAILGQQEAERRVDGTRRLLERDDVDYVSIKVSSTVAPHDPWSFDQAVEHAIESLIPLYRLARDARTPKFINLDMEEYKDLDLTIEVFTRLLDRPEFKTFEAGIVLQAYLPDALARMQQLQQWAQARVANGGARIRVRVVKGANLPMERADAEIAGWPLATWHSKEASDASYKAVLDYALRPEHVKNVQIGVAGHNLFDLALAWLLSQRRGLGDGADFEMLLGMATSQAAAVRADTGSLLLYTPVVHPDEFDVAIAYLIRRLEEGASQENFMSAVFQLDDEAELFNRERDRFLASVRSMPRETPAPNRIQNRNEPAAAWQREPFLNTPDSDASIAANREWANGIRTRMVDSQLGKQTVAAGTIDTAEQLRDVIARSVDAGPAWRALGADARAEILHRAGDMLEARRAELLEVMGSEAGKLIDQGDPEVSEAIDFAHYYAEQGRALAAIDGAEFTPAKCIAVTPPWNFPVAIPAGSTLASLASGAPVIIKPASRSCRSGAVMVEALWEAGVPRDVLQFVQFSDRSLGTELIAHPDVERVILTGGYETAEQFREARPDLPILAETSGKNAIIVTPSADFDLAARDVAHSAFGHAGQKCSAASLVILVGSVAKSKRFRNQLLDAVRSMRVGYPWQEGAQVGPIIAPPEGKLARALTTLGEGEQWMIRPEQLDDSGKLWRPGVRSGVAPGSEYHLTEYFGPILGVMLAPTLEEAVEYVNAIDYGLTSGLHSFDEAEIAYWLDAVEAGNLYVNRGITGAIVQRQPFGGWKKAAVGAGAKAGGPNYLMGFGDWQDAPLAAPDVKAARSLAPVDTHPELANALRQAMPGLSDADQDWLAAAVRTDVIAFGTEFGIVHDKTALEHEHNAFRYHAVPVTVRYEGTREVELLRVLAAGLRVGAEITCSVAAKVSDAVTNFCTQLGVQLAVEGNDAWSQRVRNVSDAGGRIRLVQADAQLVTAANSGAVSLAVYPGQVVTAGRIECLPFLREQAVSITAHRFGTPRRYEIPLASSLVATTR
ncbi:bifunctional proline dehydrogenase/L-glutamate gamma-semialdehyde dehydrogenase [Gulosibacter bifidus]|uniref:L-glutamate gamma-semialdehyde dehydrogenase n=1 Tax=Gulosibacter bifidus TaxID=272239 RepID=A0ABW5RJ68_9MICO|nr:bifunctional proline dehydrogenase/L-glutamate gamma-semialdehyde dehydrogenase [Gulosibacter bifidus]